MCHIQFLQQVNSKSIMKVNFLTGIGRDIFGGALLYHLRRKGNASLSSRLLVIWGYKSDKVYLHALLIEHESIFTWNEDRLKRLHDVYNSQSDLCSGRWKLDDGTKLKTVCGTLYKDDFEMNIIISEEKDQHQLQNPLWVDSNR
jgi:hypothetical protein